MNEHLSTRARIFRTTVSPRVARSYAMMLATTGHSCWVTSEGLATVFFWSFLTTSDAERLRGVGISEDDSDYADMVTTLLEVQSL